MYVFKFADIGEGIHEGKLAEVFVKQGDKVKDGQNLFSVETDKITAEITSPVNGTIAKVLVKVGDVVHVGQPMFEIDDGSATVAASAPAAPAPVPAQTPAPVATSIPAPAPQPVAAPVESASVVGEVKASNERLSDFFKAVAPAKPAEKIPSLVTATPVARAAAAAMGFDINAITGTGPEGRVLKADVEAYKPAAKTAVATAPASPAGSSTSAVKSVPQVPARPMDPQGDFFGDLQEKRVGISTVRNAIAKVLKTSWNNVAYTNLVNEIEVSNLVALRSLVKDKMAENGVKITYLPYIIKAFTKALERYPLFNATYDEAKNEFVYRRAINIGIAVDAPQGLTVPVIKNANHLSITQITNELNRLAAATRANKLSMADISGGTFSITNFGSFGALTGVPVIKWPELAIGGVGTIFERPMFDEQDRVVKGHFMNLTVCADHRWIDGADIGRFVKEVSYWLDNPALLLH